MFIISRKKQRKMYLSQQVRKAQGALWSIVLFSIINLFTVLFGLYFLFSAQIPLLAQDLILYAGDEMASAGEAVPNLVPISIVVAFVLILPYFFIALLAQKHKWAMVLGLIFWLVDTLVCVWFAIGADISMLIDVAFHIIGVVELVQGVKASNELGN